MFPCAYSYACAYAYTYCSEGSIKRMTHSSNAERIPFLLRVYTCGCACENNISPYY